MINKDDIKIGSLVAYLDPCKNDPMKIFKVIKVNEKSFNVERNSYYSHNVKFEESKNYTVLTQEQIDKIFNNALEEYCRENMTNIHRAVGEFENIKRCLHFIIDVDDRYGVKFTVDMDSTLKKLDDMLDKLIEVGGKHSTNSIYAY